MQERNYGELLFDKLQFTKKLDSIVQESKVITIDEKIKNNMFGNIHMSSLETSVQKAAILKVSDLIIYTVVKYVIHSAVPKIIEEMNKTIDMSSEEDQEFYAKLGEELLRKEESTKLITSYVKQTLHKAEETFNNVEDKSQDLDIDKLYGLQSGSMIGVAAEIFTNIAIKKEEYTHIVILDDNYGYVVIANLQPQNTEAEGENK